VLERVYDRLEVGTTRRESVATNLEELERRVQALEAAVASLREELANGSAAPKASAAGLLQRSQPPDESAELQAWWDSIYRRAGVTPGEEPTIEQTRARLAAEGILPRDEDVRQILAEMGYQEDEEEEPE
jgi:hypothetical protein